MAIREGSIIAEFGPFWVYAAKRGYEVMRPRGACACEVDSTYAPTPDGLSIAVARARYLYNRHRAAGVPDAVIASASRKES